MITASIIRRPDDEVSTHLSRLEILQLLGGNLQTVAQIPNKSNCAEECIEIDTDHATFRTTQSF
jgi:hypothetical protein